MEIPLRRSRTLCTQVHAKSALSRVREFDFGIRAKRVCLQDRVPSAATLLVQPMQLHEVVPSLYCRVSYSMFGLESDANVQTRVICLFILFVEVWLGKLAVEAEGPWAGLSGGRRMNRPLKLLFICSQNKIRSLTAEHMLQGVPGLAVKSTGTEARWHWRS